MADRPTFLLGLGAMKAGTSWVHDHLAASPQVVTGYRKEYHVLNAVDLAADAGMRAKILARARRATHPDATPEQADAGSLLQAAMVADVSLYPDYFAGLLSSGARLALDITPAYAMLGPERLRWVHDSFTARGVRPVAAFWMRDPVDRLGSHVRMMRARHPEKFPGSTEEHVLAKYTHPAFESRTRYERTLTTIAAAFAPEDTYLGFYETLFTDDSIESLSAFCGIAPHAAAFDVRSNPSPPDAPLTDQTQRRLVRHFADTYEAVARACPGVDLPSIWPSARLL